MMSKLSSVYSVGMLGCIYPMGKLGSKLGYYSLYFLNMFENFHNNKAKRKEEERIYCSLGSREII